MNRRLSQNFLFDPGILERIVRASGVGGSDTVVEIGPGHGRLTRMLSERVARVIAIELDPGLFGRLRDALRDRPNVDLILGDALKYPFGEMEGEFRAVANIPYHITTPIIFKLIEQRPRLLSMTLALQKEVAERIAASPGSRRYGVLSLMVQYCGRPSLEFVIPRGAFRPVPKVDSACLHVEMLRRPAVSVSDEGFFKRVIRTAFSQRRKTLRNSLKDISGEADEALRAAGIEPSERPERLGLEDFARLSEELATRAGIAARSRR